MAMTYAEQTRAIDDLLALVSKQKRIIAGLRKLLREKGKAKNLLSPKGKKGGSAAA